MVKINVAKGRARWEAIMKDIGIRCPVRENKMAGSMDVHSDKSTGAKSFVLASIKLDHMVVLLRNFPYHEFTTSDDSLAREIQATAALFVECMDTMYSGLDTDNPSGREQRADSAEKVRVGFSCACTCRLSEQCIALPSLSSSAFQLFLLTARALVSVLQNATQFYIHALAFHIVPVLKTGIDLWSLSCATGEARQRGRCWSLAHEPTRSCRTATCLFNARFLLSRFSATQFD